ncbi:MAG: SMC-Scp complex subunit ScpB, partial [Nitrosopumilus sp.]
MSTENLELRARIEAALYAAGRPLSLDELVRASGITSRKKVLESARALGVDVSKALTALQVLEIDNERFVMQLKSEYSNVAKRFATRPLLPKCVMKTLSYIVYFQPIMGQELASRRGGQAYPHLKELRSMGFIKSERMG